jgi:hypothetical protein
MFEKNVNETSHDGKIMSNMERFQWFSKIRIFGAHMQKRKLSFLELKKKYT